MNIYDDPEIVNAERTMPVDVSPHLDSCVCIRCRRERHQCDPGDTVCMVCAWMPVRPTATRPAPPAS